MRHDPEPAIRASTDSVGISVLVLRGDKDAFASAAETDSLAAMVSAERTKIYTNTGHAVHWERPNAFAKDVLAFIQSP